MMLYPQLKPQGEWVSAQPSLTTKLLSAATAAENDWSYGLQNKSSGAGTHTRGEAGNTASNK